MWLRRAVYRSLNGLLRMIDLLPVAGPLDRESGRRSMAANRAGFTMRTVLAAVLLFATPVRAAELECDIVVYGGTPGGISAAIQATRMGKSAVLIEPGKYLGGMTTGGLGATDIGNKAAIGGIAREFYQRVRKYYADDAHWTHERRADFKGRGHEANDDAAWTFEPHVATRIVQDFVREHKVPVVVGQRLDLARGVTKDGSRIV